MKPVILAAAMFLFPLVCAAQPLNPQQLHQQEIQRALIQLDQRGADFARGTVSPPSTRSSGARCTPTRRSRSNCVPTSA